MKILTDHSDFQIHYAFASTIFFLSGHLVKISDLVILCSQNLGFIFGHFCLHEFRRILGYVVFIFIGAQDMTPLDYRRTIEENFLLSSTILVSEIFACQREIE